MSERNDYPASANNPLSSKPILSIPQQVAMVAPSRAAHGGRHRMVKAKSRPPEKWQLGLTFDELPAAKANAEENKDVPQADRGLPNPLPASAESPTSSETGTSDLSGNPDIRHAGNAKSIVGTVSNERTATQSITTGNGRRADRPGNVFTPGLATKPALRPVQTGFAFLDAPDTTPSEPETVPAQAPGLTLESQPFRLPLTDNPTTLGFKAKAKATLAAIRLLKQLEAENRPATLAEKHTLAGFSGFGLLANYIFPEPGTQHFKPGWEMLGAELSELLTPEEYESAKRSTFNAFYTAPTVMQAIYAGLARLGVPQTGIHALEPGCGIGNFMGMAPVGIRFTGIEKEVLSGRIAKALYPEQDIRIEPFQQTTLPAGSMDVAVGNVPFSDLTLKWQESKLPLHDYFFAKALDSLHEGGILALVTSRYTLDKQDATFRTYLAEQADFLGAIRLPKGAFRQEGTEVVTDVIFLRKRGKKQTLTHAGDWLTTEALPGGKSQCNRYFLEHPAMVIGELAEDRGMYGNHELTVTFPNDYQQRLQSALNWLPENAYSAAPRNQQPPAQQTTFRQEATPSRKLLPGSLFKGADGQIMTVVKEAGTAEPLRYGGTPVNALSGTVGARLTALIGIRDAARAVLESQREGLSEAEKAAARYAVLVRIG